MVEIPAWHVLQILREDRRDKADNRLNAVEQRVKQYLESQLKLAGLPESSVMLIADSLREHVTRSECISVLDTLPTASNVLDALEPRFKDRMAGHLTLSQYVTHVVREALKEASGDGGAEEAGGDEYEDDDDEGEEGAAAMDQGE